MSAFGAKSRSKLDTVDPRLVSVLEVVIKDTDFTVLCGKRGKAQQLEYKHTGRSKVGWPDSAHNCPIPEEGVPRSQWKEDPDALSRAVDIAPWPINWKDEKQFAYLAGRVVQEGKNQGVKIRWGGDWDMDGQGVWRDPDESFNDMPHFEVVD